MLYTVSTDSILTDTADSIHMGHRQHAQRHADSIPIGTQRDIHEPKTACTKTPRY